jgi:serine/threonine protein kinase
MIPDKIGRYEVKAEIGRGGMATVFHAYDPLFERDVAIKILPQALLHDPHFRVRFEREAKTVASLEHSAIVPVYDFGEEAGQPYIVMRYMSGGSLSDRIRQGALTLTEAAEIVSRLAPALDAAHQNSIIHRDLKPGNILFDQYGNAFLSDFGIARLAHQAEATVTGEAIIGTPEYMSPEQIQGDRDIDGRSDIYSFGIILYQMLTGQPPYKSDTPAKTMMMHLLDPVPQAQEALPDLAPGFNRVISKAMAKNPEGRFSTAGELELALQKTMKSFEVRSARARLAPDQSDEFADSNPQEWEGELLPPGSAPTSGKQRQLKPRVRISFALLGILVLISLGIGGVLGFMNRPWFLPQAMVTPPAPTQPVSSGAEDDLADTGDGIASAHDTLPGELTPASTEVRSQPTHTPAATLTPTPNPKELSPPVPPVPVIGEADKVAFLNENDVWIVNLDGSGLRQLTQDGGYKTNLQWPPDGEAVNYILGKCIQSVNIFTLAIENLACFEAAEDLDAFEISPDGSLVAISVNRELYTVSYQPDQLKNARSRSDLVPMAVCQWMAPYNRNYVKTVRWSEDGNRLAMVVQGFSGDQQVDLVRVLDISECTEAFPRLDEFPAERFSMPDYDKNPIIQNFAWDGDMLFALASYNRNDGFGHLWVYNLELRKAEQINPIDGKCCYRDPQWSPDGRYLLFTFQDMLLAPLSKIELYYLPFGTVGTGLKYEPVPLPPDFFQNPKEKPQPALRPIKGQP